MSTKYVLYEFINGDKTSLTYYYKYMLVKKTSKRWGYLCLSDSSLFINKRIQMFDEEFKISVTEDTGLQGKYIELGTYNSISQLMSNHFELFI